MAIDPRNSCKTGKMLKQRGRISDITESIEFGKKNAERVASFIVTSVSKFPKWVFRL